MFEASYKILYTEKMEFEDSIPNSKRYLTPLHWTDLASLLNRSAGFYSINFKFKVLYLYNVQIGLNGSGLMVLPNY